MLRWFLYTLGIIAFIALAIGLYFLRLMYDVGSFRTIEAHFEGSCERMGGFAGGTEDLQIDHNTGWVFVSADDRRAELVTGSAPRGAIQAFDLNNIGDGIFNVTPDMPEGFRPHGVSLYQGEAGARLFVISHPENGSQDIVIFDVIYDGAGVPSLSYAETITDPLIVSPNDLVAVGPRSFYVGNDFSTAERGGTGYMLELFGRLNRTTLIYYDGQEASVAARGLTYANGVNVSPDGETLYLAETTDGTLRIYDRDVETGVLTQRAGAAGMLNLHSGLDNIDIDAEGRVWIAAHPKLFDVQDHMEDPANLSPAQVIMLDPDGEGGGALGEVFLGNGVLASGSSVAAYYDGTMVIGVIFDKHVVVCDVTDPNVIGVSN